MLAGRAAELEANNLPAMQQFIAAFAFEAAAYRAFCERRHLVPWDPYETVIASGGGASGGDAVESMNDRVARAFGNLGAGMRTGLSSLRARAPCSSSDGDGEAAAIASGVARGDGESSDFEDVSRTTSEACVMNPILGKQQSFSARMRSLSEEAAESLGKAAGKAVAVGSNVVAGATVIMTAGRHATAGEAQADDENVTIAPSTLVTDRPQATTATTIPAADSAPISSPSVSDASCSVSAAPSPDGMAAGLGVVEASADPGEAPIPFANIALDSPKAEAEMGMTDFAEVLEPTFGESSPPAEPNADEGVPQDPRAFDAIGDGDGLPVDMED